MRLFKMEFYKITARPNKQKKTDHRKQCKIHHRPCRYLVKFHFKQSHTLPPVKSVWLYQRMGKTAGYLASCGDFIKYLADPDGGACFF